MPPSDGHGGSTRSTPKGLLILAGLLLAARVAFGIIDATHPESRTELVQWTAPSAAVEAARASGRLVLYVFTDAKVPASRKLSSQVFASQEMADQIGRRFVAVRVDGPPADDTPEIAEMRSRFGVSELPAMVLANPDGSKHKRIAGYESPMATMQALTQAQMEVMDIPFQRGGAGPRGGRSFRFQFGHGSPDSTEATGEADSLARMR